MQNYQKVTFWVNMFFPPLFPRKLSGKQLRKYRAMFTMQKQVCMQQINFFVFEQNKRLLTEKVAYDRFA